MDEIFTMCAPKTRPQSPASKQGKQRHGGPKGAKNAPKAELSGDLSGKKKLLAELWEATARATEPEDLPQRASKTRHPEPWRQNRETQRHGGLKGAKNTPKQSFLVAENATSESGFGNATPRPGWARLGLAGLGWAAVALAKLPHSFERLGP